MGLIKTIFAGVVVVVLAAEILAWLPRLTECILRCAVRRLPEGLRDRYEEEWRADINDRPGMLSNFISACGLLVAGSRLRRTEVSGVIERELQEKVRVAPLVSEDYSAVVMGRSGGPPIAYWRCSDGSQLVDEM